MDNFQIYYDQKAAWYRRVPLHDTIYQNILREVQGTNLRILDVGCASGNLGELLQQKGHAVYGVEISDQAAQVARKKLTEVISGNIEMLQLPWDKHYFDVIICADVLEHLIFPEQTLMKLRQYLKDNGVLLVSVPNVAHWSIRWCLLLGKWNYQETGLLDSGHLRFFTYQSFVELLRKTGYEVKHLYSSFKLPKWLKRLNRFWSGVLQICSYFPTLFGYQFFLVARKLVSNC
jgi:2-polyprenyl-3-methyl-5-hydroxy-6-metoxy-1,4-benzoquinol methylase